MITTPNKKNKTILLGILTVVLLFIGSCAKDKIADDGHGNLQPVESAKLNSLKQQYGRQENLVLNNDNWLNSLSPDWDKVNVNMVNGNKVYEVSLKNPKRVFTAAAVVDQKNAEKLQNSSLMKLLVFEDLKGNLKTCFMELIAFNQPEKLRQLRYRDYKDFDGIVNFYEMDGTLANGWMITKGKVTAGTNGSLVNNLSVANGKNKGSAGSAKLMTGEMVECGTTLVPHYKQVCFSTDGIEGYPGDGYSTCNWQQYHTTETLYCPVPPDPNDGGYQGGGTGADNDQPAAIGENRFKLKPSDQRKYPRFTAMIKELPAIVKNDVKIMRSLKLWSGLTEAQILDKLKFGQGPEIIIKELTGKYGYFNRLEDPNAFNISASFVRGLEQSNLLGTQQATAFLLGVTVLHEFVHQARAANGLDRDYEYGDKFENSAFGLIIGGDNAGNYSYIFYAKSN